MSRIDTYRQALRSIDDWEPYLLAESGLPGFDLTAWGALVAPRGLPADVRGALVKSLAAAMATPAMREDLRRVGIEVLDEPPSAYEARVNREPVPYTHLTRPTSDLG